MRGEKIYQHYGLASKTDLFENNFLLLNLLSIVCKDFDVNNITFL